MRLAQQRPPQQHQIGVALADDRVGLSGLGDQPDGAGRDARLAPDLLGEAHLEPRAHRDDGVGHRAAGRAIHQVAAQRGQFARQRHRLLVVPAAGDPIGAGEAHPERQTFGPLAPHRGRDLAHQARAVLERAAPAVGAAIGERRQELVQQVAVGGMHLDQFGAGGAGATGRGGEGGDHARDAGFVQLLRRLVAGREGKRAGRDDGVPAAVRRPDRPAAQPGRRRGGLAPGVRQLEARHAALRGDERADAAQGLDLGIVPQAEVGRADAALRHHRGRLDQQSAQPARGAAAQVRQVPVGGAAVDRRILAHRGHDQAVAQAHAPLRKRGEQMVGHGRTSLGRGGYCRRKSSRSKGRPPRGSGPGMAAARIR